MSELRLLIAGGAYIDNEGLRELCKLWARVVTYLDPTADVIIIDSASPFEPSQFLDWPIYAVPPPNEERWIYRFDDNVGHLSRGGEDGGGRTYCKALELAIEGGYTHLAFIETDLLFLRSAGEIVRRMVNNGTKVCALSNPQYNFPEFGVTFFDVKWARDFDFIKKYNWKASQPWPIPEVRLLNILEEYLMLLPLYGMRNDHHTLTVDNMANMFPYGPIAWITHCNDINLYTRAIVLNNIRLP